MTTSFDNALERAQTDSLKFDKRDAIFGRADVQPLWVADTDFAVAPAISNALQARLDHPIFGYSLYPEAVYTSVIGWFKRKHGVEIKREWLMFAPGVMTSIAAAIRATTQPGDGVIVQPPVYHVFFPAIINNARVQINNPLVYSNGDYQLNLSEFEQQVREGARALIFCSPHNPVGRVWRKDELAQLLAIARQNRTTVISDDIHCDLAYSGHRHQFLFELADEQDALITTIAPNKTFNIPAFGLSLLIVKNPQLRRALQQEFDALLLGGVNPLSVAALGAAYGGQSDQWHDELMAYLQANRDFVHDFFATRDLGIKANLPQATFLTWLDCRALGLSDTQLKRFFVEDCALGLSPGTGFGSGGAGFMRLNLGTSRVQLEAALLRIETACNSRLGE